MEAGARDVPPSDHGRGRTADLPDRVALDGRDFDDRGLGGHDLGTSAVDESAVDEFSGDEFAFGEFSGGESALGESAGDVPDTADAPADPGAEAQSFRELRPQRRLRIWQLAPIVALGTLGSLMFAFPLAFEFGDSGAVVAMLGLLLCCCCAGWGIMAARRVGYTWPGLPARGSGRCPDWRFIALYSVLTVVLAVLAVWRVARLR